MNFELNTEPGPPDREERRGIFYAIIACVLLFGGFGLSVWLFC